MQIQLPNNKTTLVSDEDYDSIKSFKWHIGAKGYVMGWMGGKTPTYLHRFIMKTPRGYQTDHINGDRLDNRRDNLRVCTASQNSINHIMNKNNKTGYKGVYWHKHSQKWVVYVTKNGKQVYGGIFTDVKLASRARQDLARKLFGDYVPT